MYKIGRGKSFRFEAQHLWSDDDRKNWVGGTLEYNISSRLGFYVNDIYNYGSDDETERIHYYNPLCILILKLHLSMSVRVIFDKKLYRELI